MTDVYTEMMVGSGRCVEATDRAGGTGMGLAISKSLAELQHGGLAVTSVIGSGSCFVLSLPVNAI